MEKTLDQCLKEEFQESWSWVFYEHLGYRVVDSEEDKVALDKAMAEIIESFKKAAYNWLESKRLMPLSRKPDVIEISDLQAELQCNSSKKSSEGR